MAASKKEGGKNRKIGRHSRNPSSKLQKLRTERNKARRLAALKARKVSQGQNNYPKPRPLTREEILANERVVFFLLVPDNRATHILVANGVTIDTGSHYQVSATQRSLDPRHKGAIFPFRG